MLDNDGSSSDRDPAIRRMSTTLEWADLVLDEATHEEIDDIVQWVRHRDTLMQDWGLSRRLKPCFASLFYGPPGTGKTLAATLIGKVTGCEVYRVDPARVISTYIGETEKNLDTLFERAAHGNWILFFDEADALFGRRTESRNADDRAVNQQIGYLLQRLEEFPGVVIVASNFRSNIDEAFARRFQSVIHFPMPAAEQRLKLWTDMFAGQPMAPDVDLRTFAHDHELSGGAIADVLRYACLKAVQRKSPVVSARDILGGIQRYSPATPDSQRQTGKMTEP